MTKKIIIVTGPTASGKTNLSIKLAQDLKGEIINADSLQVYKENLIISAQPTIQEQKNIPHHLFSYVNGDEEYNVSRWIGDAKDKIETVEAPILVGGTGFYLKHLMFGLSPIPDIDAETKLESETLLKNIGLKEFYQILKQLDPVIAADIDHNNARRVLRAYEVIKSTGRSISEWQKENIQYFPLSSFRLVILNPDRQILYQNCNKRFLEMIDLGVIDEVNNLLEKNYSPISGIMKSHGIPELSKYLRGEWSLEEAIAKSQQVTRNYIKRQTTWFKYQFNHPELQIHFVQDKNNYSEILNFILKNT